jgi:hypothetical protein
MKIAILILIIILLIIFVFVKYKKTLRLKNFEAENSERSQNIEQFELDKNIGKIFHGILLESFFDDGAKGGSRIRVRPLEFFNKDTRVEFPRAIREEHDVGTIFNASIKVCQKTYETSGKPKGKPYLLADKKTIIVN